MLAKEERHLLINRIDDLVTASDKRRYPSHTEFLDMTEASTAMVYLDSIHRKYKVSGGYDDAERQVIIIFPEYASDFDYVIEPMSFISVKSANNRYIKQPSHRDYLGALMNLGIERRVLGDILMVDQGAILVCMSHIEGYISSNLCQVANAEVSLEIISEIDESQYQRSFKLIRNTVASLRLDSIVKICINASRGDSATMIRCGKVYVNGREISKINFIVEEGHVLSVRGYGKFKVRHIGNKTKKDRLIVEIDKYI